MLKKLTITALLAIALTTNTYAWVYPEHRGITLVAIQKLDSARKVILNKLWLQARKGHESRLDSLAADFQQDVKPNTIDFAAWPAIAADHSTSPQNMIHNILNTKWILNVADITARLKNGIAKAKNNSEVEAELRNSDIRLLRADPEYVSRAGSNYVHFMLARKNATTTANEYFEQCYDSQSDINLAAMYQWYHTSAISKAYRLVTETLTPEQYSALSLAILADEAFALHFLEDAFAAGHVAGTWGNASQRKGTHDYYDEAGLEINTWSGKRLVISGDAYLRPSDASHAGEIINMSLSQVLDVISEKSNPTVLDDQKNVFTPDTFNISKAIKTPVRAINESLLALTNQVLLNTPIPGLSSGIGELPRFRSELGPFIGISPAASISAISGGFGTSQTTNGNIPSLEFAIHMGLGTDGVLNKSGDGLVFLDLGWRLDNVSNITVFTNDPLYKEFGSILSAIPSRETFYARLRMPFYVIPGDLLVAAPLLLLFAPNSLNTMIATAGQGGLIPWQTGIITPLGRFQFMLGREVGVYFYGRILRKDAYLIPDTRVPNSALALVSMNTTKLDFPILEFRPLRSFSNKQSANLFVQLNAGVDLPGKVTVKSPYNMDPMKLKPIWFIKLRLGFDWRYYISKNK